MKILVLGDGVMGHARQCEAVAQMLKDSCVESGHPPASILQTDYKVDVKFKRSLAAKILYYALHPQAKRCNGCNRCIRYQVSDRDYAELSGLTADIIISAFGKRTADVNRWLASRLGAKSVVVMTPRRGLSKFDLAIIPRHDRVEDLPNVIRTEGSINFMSPQRVLESAAQLAREIGPMRLFKVALLLGGDYKHFRMSEEMIARVLSEVKEACENLDAEMMVTASRRTPTTVIDLLKSELRPYPRCRLLVIPEEYNPPGAVAGILGLSDIVIVSPESVNMVSEAASSGAHVIVFDEEHFVHEKHRAFLHNLQSKGNIELVPIHDIAIRVRDFYHGRAHTALLDDRPAIKSGLQRLLAI
ncbi:MAG: ELM1/GtrOC1 family putative glycosyltransferase [Candidatus Omnitrophota bacterium]|nr:ELM1/GtrOC1 family putative glycosyltransferase [Candidatus Omnitrophota bacterium]